MWDKIIGPILVTVALFKVMMSSNHHPLAPWDKVGSVAEVLVVNETPAGPLYVVAEAPAVDSAIRTLGFVLPQSSSIFRLPYADTRVIIRVEDLATFELKVDGPRRYRLEVK